MNTVTHTNTNRMKPLRWDPLLLDQNSIHTEGRDKAMDIERMDIVNMVADKLETLNNLIEFYWYAREKTGFSKEAINGLCLILSDCTAQLKDVVK